MRKLILGIVAVVCVQITFQALTAVERLDAETRSHVKIVPLVAPITGDPVDDVAKLPTESESPQVYGEAVRPEASTPSFKRATVTVAPRPAFGKRAVSRNLDRDAMVAMADEPAAPEIFTPQIITYPAHLMTTEAPRREKRSVFTKALPVIKKPYEWLRSVGSKLK
jgi:hypothetical protein